MAGNLRRALTSARPALLAAALLSASLLALLSGCSTPLTGARANFYAGHFAEAEASLTNVVPRPKDKVLFLMERGTIRQQRGEYADSTKDYIAAAAEIDRLWTISASKGATSFVVNDNVQDFSGAPYERTLLEVLNAHNFLAQGDWDNAAVGARRVIRSLDPDRRGGYPEDAYSRYLAGFCLAMIDDDSNATIQYHKADELARRATIDPHTGRVGYKSPAAVATNASKNAEAPLLPPLQPVPPVPAGSNTAELVCFVLTGRTPPGDANPALVEAFSLPMYAEIRHHGQVLGRSYVLTDTGELARQTAEKEAVGKAIKTGIRVAIRAALAIWAEQKHEGLGVPLFMLLMMLEEPDVRRWETLPQQLQVARVPCPPDLKDFDIVFRASGGATVRTLHITQPIAHRRNIFVAVVRDLTAVTAPHVLSDYDDRPHGRALELDTAPRYYAPRRSYNRY
jgi:hypothetical protein